MILSRVFAIASLLGGALLTDPKVGHDELRVRQNPSLADCQNPQAPTSNGETISCTTPRANTVVWRIDRPTINSPQTNYPNIRFQQGDLVSVFAGGCAQHGGTGLTWKRYVNPMTPGKNADDSHHGLISVPGFGSLGYIRDAVMVGGIAVLADPGAASSLTLGYTDDGNGDDGYYDHDDGWWEQCNDLPNAWVVIAIQHGCATSPAPECVRGRALDLVVDRRDANNFPENPDWVFTRVTGKKPNAADVCSWSTKVGTFPTDDASLCVSQATEHDGAGVCVQGGTAGQLAGHMNWVGAPVTNIGWIWWDGHDYYWDDDYTLNIASLDASGHVSGALFLDGQTNPQTEFKSDETIDQISGVPWWNSLHTAVNSEDEKLHTADAIPTGVTMPAELFPAGLEAIVIGQLGLDCAHSCNSELHPAYAFFVHTKDDLKDDTWAFFVRNWGNEGFCSGEDHRISSRQITVRLPRLYASQVQLLIPQTIVGSNTAIPPYSVVMEPGGNAALATFNLPAPDQHGITFGELHLKWTIPINKTVLATHITHIDPKTIYANRLPKDSTEVGAEEELTRLLSSLNAKERDELLFIRRPPPPPPPLLRKFTVRVAPRQLTIFTAPMVVSSTSSIAKDSLSLRRARAATFLAPNAKNH